MFLDRFLKDSSGMALFRVMVAIVILAIVTINAGVWLVGNQLFIEDARQLDQQLALRRVDRVENLLAREAVSVRRILLGRAERLLAEMHGGPAVWPPVDFTRLVTAEFLVGANLDAYVVVDASLSVLYAAKAAETVPALSALAAGDQQALLSLLSKHRHTGGFSGLATLPDGRLSLVACVPVGPEPPRGWVMALRDLDAGQVERYGDILEHPFSLSPVSSAVHEGVVFDEPGQRVTRSVNDLSGQPAAVLGTVYDSSFARHVTQTVAVARISVFLLSLVVGGMMILIVCRWRINVIREQNSRLEVERIARLASLGELSAGIAHEINNPGGMIRRNLEFVGDVVDDALVLLAEREDAGDLTLGGVDFSVARSQLPQLLADMQHGSRRIGEIVRDLKEFASYEAQSVELVDVNEAVTVALRLLGGTVHKATDRFELKLSPELPRVAGNLRQIEQVVMNLVANACHALPSKDCRVAVSTSYNAVQRKCLVVVEDAGVGMDRAVMDRVFEPFFTTRRETGGTGLGLSISLRIAQRHNGTIVVDSTPGCGTRMTLILPAAKEQP